MALRTELHFSVKHVVLVRITDLLIPLADKAPFGNLQWVNWKYNINMQLKKTPKFFKYSRFNMALFRDVYGDILPFNNT